MYRIQYGLSDVSSDYTTKSQHSLRGHPIALQQVWTRLKLYTACFFPATVTPWNRLPASVVTAPSLDVFKGRVLEALQA